MKIAWKKVFIGIGLVAAGPMATTVLAGAALNTGVVATLGTVVGATRAVQSTLIACEFVGGWIAKQGVGKIEAGVSG